MGYAEDIRTIAKTKELTDKADKALRIADEAKRAAINAQRVIAHQSGDTTKNVSAGNNGSGDQATGTGNTGDPIVDAPLAPPPQPPDDNSSTTSQTDSGSSSISVNGVDQGGSNANDLSGNGKTQSTTTAGGTGTTSTETKGQADPANAGDAAWDAISAALIAQGYNPGSDVYEAARRAYWTKEPGKHEVSDVYNGDAGPKPTNFGSILTDNVDIIDLDKKSERLNAVVGVDPDDNSKAVEIRFDNFSKIPSIEEAIAAGQLEWTSLTEAPRKPAWEEFQQGYMWTVSNPWAATADAPAVVMDLAIARLVAANPGGVYTDAHWEPSSLAPSGVNYTATWYEEAGTAGAPNNVTILRSSCVATDEATCPTTAQHESSFPIIGHYLLKLFNGQFIQSIFDSEVPLKYKGIKSSVTIKSAITGDNYTIEPSNDGGFMIYNASSPEWLLIYNSDRTFRFPVSIAQYNYYAPRPR